MSDLVLRNDAGGVATLVLNRPEKRNAINRELFRALRGHVVALQSDSSVRLVVIRGEGDHFCAGHGLGEKPHADALGWLRKEVHTLELLSKLRQPVIAAVRGTCFTGGLELALAADFIICDETARFADTHGKWGLVPGWGMSQRLPRRVGSARAIEMMVTCRPVTGVDAERAGLANLCVVDGALDAALADYAEAILAISPHSNAENKRLVYDTDGMRLAQGIDHEVMRNAGFDRDAATRRASFPGAAVGGGQEAG
ncbi:enoyl-CoA hydratase/isomerase family protein [Novosphingobium taihuense]|uniref:Enoyl-CoA hydratase/carnithine racemase n=1 Tax=Novosphingobium taihuense TaxID=260085 RepID=A0A7W7EVU6_9SPHN|nr:enoyl-CoA hydratase/isomerase family protein [Novosphingobium taihuense]MBB4615424.1 enoyl-CoA hydratase/carnithine racemase [Novosphingobium taihuense]TWH82128.1 enoyl-CoA hydratase/carnithine racemase [Novosphingobium taihuense]